MTSDLKAVIDENVKESINKYLSSEESVNAGVVLISLSNQIIKLEKDSKGNIIPLDATRDNARYNQNNYPSFDPHNLHMGQFTSIDNVHASTINGKFSDNPMDSNWGGVLHTQDSVESGKYKGREPKSSSKICHQSSSSYFLNHS